MNVRLALAAAGLAAMLPSAGLTQAAPKPAAAITRPPIVGVAHIALKTKDLAASREFYGHYLGYQEAFSVDKPAGGLLLTYFKVNDHQYIEIFPGLTGDAEDRLMHIAFETTNARQLRDYLASRGVKVPDTLKPWDDGNLSFMTKDPDGHDVEFVQYMPGSLHAKNFGKLLPAARISERIIHVGATVSDQAAADRFYKDILGFHEFWHGGRTDESVDWVDMRVPDGTDWMEYMLNSKNPTPAQRGVMNHMALGVPSVDAGHKTLLGRKLEMKQPPKIGRDGKWQLNLYDPDLTRAELMEPRPVEKPCCSVMLDN
jgi:catechol 2,3-dioxygenase-like lactoylglutathione lyase family enzyme